MGGDEIVRLILSAGADRGAKKQNSGVFISSLVVPLFHRIIVTFLSESLWQHFKGLPLSVCLRVWMQIWCRSMLDYYFSTALNVLCCTCAGTGHICYRAWRVQWYYEKTPPSDKQPHARKERVIRLLCKQTFSCSSLCAFSFKGPTLYKVRLKKNYYYEASLGPI